MKLAVKRTNLIASAVITVYLSLMAIVSVSAGSGQDFASGPPTAHTGAPPSEATCTDCHSQSTLTGQFHIIPPAAYVPGQTYAVQVQNTTSDLTRKAWGFELTSLTAANAAAGTFANTTTFTRTSSAGGRNYVAQTSTGVFRGQTGGSSWTFNWTAPATNVGSITLYAAGLQADNSGDESGDQTYTTSAVVPVAAPTASQIVSRKLHAGVPFDIALPATGTAGVECRSGGGTNDYQVVFTFPTTVTFTGAALTAGAGSVSSSSGSGTNTVTVNLTGITNAQRITVTLSNVNNGTISGNVSVPMGVLVGDTTGDGTVNAADIGQTKSQSGNTVTASNFRQDVNLDGSVNASDIGLVKSKSGTALP